MNLALIGCHAGQIVQVFFDEAQRSFEIGVIVFIGHTPTQRTEFTSFNDDGVQVADGEDEVLPVGVIDLFDEFLVDHCGEGLEKTGLQTLWRFIGNFQHFLEKAQRE